MKKFGEFVIPPRDIRADAEKVPVPYPTDMQDIQNLFCVMASCAGIGLKDCNDCLFMGDTTEFTEANKAAFKRWWMGRRAKIRAGQVNRRMSN